MNFRFGVICLLVLSNRVNGADTVTCELACDDYIDSVWVDGVDKKPSISPQGQWHAHWIGKVLTFDDSATVLAIRCRDYDLSRGCSRGGMATRCTSTRANSIWNMNEVDDRTSWRVNSRSGSYNNPSTDANGRSWYQVDYMDMNSQFIEPLVGTLANAAYGPGICGGPGERSHWNFLYTASNAGAGGDPHFVGFGHQFFSWQGVCTLILLKTPKLSSSEPELSFHIRTKKIRKWSAIGTVAVQIENDVVEVESNDGKLLMNGKEVSMIKSKFVSATMSKLHKKVFVYTFDFGKKRKLEVEVNTRSKMLYTTVKGGFPPGTIGLLGSPHNPGMFARDGTKMTDKDVNSFVESWQVRDGDPKLFHKMEGPQYPSKCYYPGESDNNQSNGRRLKEVQSMTREAAIAACAAHHLSPLREFCIEDMLATGAIESATSSFYE